MTFAEEVTQGVIQAYDLLLSSLPPFAQNFVNLFLIVAVIFIYSVFVWKLYRFVSTKNILGLNLNQYNKSSYPLMTKMVAGMFFFVEYIIILPFLIFFWFAIFALFLILLTENLTINAVLVLAAVIVSAVRMTSYIPGYGEDLSRDLAKLFPFTLLAVSLLNPGFFDFERILGQFTELPNLFGQMFYYLLFIMILEVVLRFFDFIFSLLGLEEDEEENPEEEEDKKEQNSD